MNKVWADELYPWIKEAARKGCKCPICQKRVTAHNLYVVLLEESKTSLLREHTPLQVLRMLPYMKNVGDTGYWDIKDE